MPRQRSPAELAALSVLEMMCEMGATLHIDQTTFVATWSAGGLEFRTQMPVGTANNKKQGTKARNAINDNLTPEDSRAICDAHAAHLKGIEQARNEKAEAIESKTTLTDFIEEHCKIRYIKVAPDQVYRVLMHIADNYAPEPAGSYIKKIGFDTEGNPDPIFAQIAICLQGVYYAVLVYFEDALGIGTFKGQYKRFVQEMQAQTCVFGAGLCKPDRVPFEVDIAGIPENKFGPSPNDLQRDTESLANAVQRLLPDSAPRLTKHKKGSHFAAHFDDERSLHLNAAQQPGLTDAEKYAIADAVATAAVANGCILCSQSTPGFFPLATAEERKRKAVEKPADADEEACAPPCAVPP